MIDADLVEAERRRVAFHEAGHAAMCHVLRRRVRLVALVDNGAAGGVCWFDSNRVRRDDADDFSRNLGRPLPLMNARVRRSLEVDALITLAGRAAEDLVGPRDPGFVATSQDDGRAERIARQLAGPLAEAGHPDELASDETVALATARIIAGRGVVFAYASWLQLEARRLVLDPAFRKLVAPLAEELLEHEVVTGRRAREILIRAERVPA